MLIHELTFTTLYHILSAHSDVTNTPLHITQCRQHDKPVPRNPNIFFIHDLNEELTYYQLRGLGSPLCQLVKLEGPDKVLVDDHVENSLNDY